MIIVTYVEIVTRMLHKIIVIKNHHRGTQGKHIDSPSPSACVMKCRSSCSSYPLVKYVLDSFPQGLLTTGATFYSKLILDPAVSPVL